MSPPPACPHNSGVFKAINWYLVPKCKGISPKINLRWLQVSDHHFTPIIFDSRIEVKIINGGQKMVDRMKPLSFYRQLKFPLLHIFDAVLYKTCETHFINLIPSQRDFCRNSLTRNESIAWKTPELRNFCRGLAKNSFGFCIIIQSSILNCISPCIWSLQ